jgi:hypothetical protein
MGSIRDVILMGDTHLISGVGALVAVAFGTNLILGQVNTPTFFGQPVAHSQHLWNFLGMVLAGLAFALAGGCPGRQLFLSGEGDGDSAVFAGDGHRRGLCAQLFLGWWARQGGGRRKHRRRRRTLWNGGRCGGAGGVCRVGIHDEGEA